MRLGIDLGGTKIAALVLGEGDGVLFEERLPTPKGNYQAIVGNICALIKEAETVVGQRCSIGIAIPGSVSPRSGLIRNANSTVLNARPFQADLQEHLGREIRLSNDANCFALSESYDGAAAGCKRVFGVIIGTGCGAGIIEGGCLVEGRHGIAGEWGHTPLPWPGESELPGLTCWCGRQNCLELWISGSGLEADFYRCSGTRLNVQAILARQHEGDRTARQVLQRHLHRLARGLAAITNILDPDVIVLGGGLSNLEYLYAKLPGAMRQWIFSDYGDVDIRPPKFGDASGVRGAARLWDGE